MVQDMTLYILQRTLYLAALPLAGVGMWYLMGLFKEIINFQKGKFKALIIHSNLTTSSKYLTPKEHGSGEVKDGLLGKKRIIVPDKARQGGYVFNGGKSGLMPTILYDGKTGTPIPWKDNIGTVEYDSGTINKMMAVAEAEGMTEGVKHIKMIIILAGAAAGLALINILLTYSVSTGV